MQQWRILFAQAAIFCVFVLGCSGSGLDPVSPPDSPDLAGDSPSLTGRKDAAAEKGTFLWGYYDLFLSVEEMSVEAVPNRSGMFTANVTLFLNMNPPTLSFSFNGINTNMEYVDIDVDISITHPLGLEKFNGYDVKGVFVENSSGTMDYAGLMYPIADTDQILRNADGYTRWFNPAEFGTPGICGYTPGLYATKNYDATATLNPYKYFGEGLGTNDNLWDYLTSGDPQVGYFIAGSTNTRNYQLRFPIPVPGIKYGYAVVADWTSGQPDDHPSHCPEAVAVSVVDNSDLWFVDEDTWGGEISLDITVFDWDADITSVCTEEYWIKLETNLRSGHTDVDEPGSAPIDSGDHWYTYCVDLTPEQITGIERNEIWIIIEDVEAHYDNPFGISNDAEDEPVAACFRYPLTVSSEEPPWIELVVPNMGEQWCVGESCSISWNASSSITSVDISLSLDSGETYTYKIAEGVENNGYLPWQVPVEAVGAANRIRIEDADDPSMSDASDIDFTVREPNLTLLGPGGGEEWQSGTLQMINWKSHCLNTRINIYYSTDDFIGDIQTIAENEENDGLYQWNIPSISSDTVKVKVTTEVPPLLEDESDDYFKIYSPAITVTSPNGGEVWPVPGPEQEITWDSNDLEGSVYIQWSVDNFVSDIRTIAMNEVNDGSFFWELGCEFSDTARVRVGSIGFPVIRDSSDGDFSLAESGWAAPVDSGYWELIHDVALDSEGNCYITGYVGTLPGYGIDLQKVDQCGNYLWGYAYSTGNFEQHCFDVAVDEFDNVYISGEFMGYAVEFDPTEGEDLRYSISTYNCFITSFDTDGNYRYTITWGGGEWCSVDSVCTDKTGSFYATGRISGHVDMDPGPGNYFVHYIGNTGYISKFDTDGNFQKTTIFGDPGRIQCRGIFADATGRIAVTGQFHGDDVDFDPGDGTDLHTSLGGAMEDDVMLCMYDSELNYQWGRNWGSEDGRASGYGVWIDCSGNVYTTGYFTEMADFDPDEVGTDFHTSNGSWDAWLSKFDSTGDYLWSVTWGSDLDAFNDEHGDDVCVDDGGLVYVAGAFRSTADFDPDPFDVESRTSTGEQDCFLSAFDTTGNFAWVHTWGGEYIDAATGLDVFTSDSGQKYIFCAGHFYGTDVEFATTGSPCYDESDLHTSGDSSDGFIIKLLPDGCW